MKISDRVLITCTNFRGVPVFKGKGRIKEVRKHVQAVEYIVACDDGVPRSVEVGTTHYKGDKICLE